MSRLLYCRGQDDHRRGFCSESHGVADSGITDCEPSERGCLGCDHWRDGDDGGGTLPTGTVPH